MSEPVKNSFGFRAFVWKLTRGWWFRLIVLALAMVLIPYLLSRIMASTRRIAVFHAGEIEAPATAGVETSMLRVACYNIAHGRGVAESNWSGGSPVERLDRLDQIGQLLKEIDADVVVLNEVDFDSSWSNSVNQAEYLAKAAGYSFRVEERNIDFRVLWWKWRFGNAILSRTPITQSQVIDLPEYATWETLLAGKKRAVKCIVEFNGGLHTIVGAHLSHRSEDLRVRSAQMLVDEVDELDASFVIAGDMNSTPAGFPQHHVDGQGRNAIEVFDQFGSFVRTPEAAPPAEQSLTFPSTHPQIVIDWIFTPAGSSFGNYQVLQSKLSDHLPVVADVSFF